MELTTQEPHAISKRRTLTLFLLGGLLGIVAFLLIYGVTPLNVEMDAFCRGGYIEKDIQQHYAGWLFYRQSTVSFPFCIADNINWPSGLSVAYTDSIPLFAAIFHLFEPMLPSTFQYFGWFTLIAYFLQGACGAILISLFTKSDVLSILGDIFFVASPVLAERAIRHTALGAQFFLLAALYYYFKSRRENRFAYIGLFLLNIVCITIHPYFLPMVYAITLAMLLEYAHRSKNYLRPLIYLLSDLLLTLVAGWLVGLFYGTASAGSDALYGYFGLNLNALWNPGGVTDVPWSLVLPVQNQLGGNYDAFAYLGLGVLLSLPAGLLCWLYRSRANLAGRLAALLKEYWALIGVCLILSVFAISNVVTANGAVLFTLPLPTTLVNLFSVFRSSGRMFWPIYYLLVLLSIIFIVHIKPDKVAIGVLCLAVVVQVTDISPGLLSRHMAMTVAQTQDAFPSALTGDFWVQTTGKFAHIASMNELQDDALHLAIYAADNGMTTNDPFAARFDSASLEAERNVLSEELLSGTLRSDTLYLFSDEGTFLHHVDAVPAGTAWCGEVSNGDYRWYVIAPGMADYTAGSNETIYDENYPLRIADYTDALWSHGVLSETSNTVCFVDSPFARSRLENASVIHVDGKPYPIIKFDDSDAGWLMITLDTEDASALCGKELEIE